MGVRRGSTTEIDLHVADLPALPAAVEVAAFRIVTEAVTNAVRHADASCVHVTIEEVGKLLRVTVRDDGRGFNGETMSATGNGLETMRERAEELRGRLRLTDEGGTTVIAEIPLPSATRPSQARPVSASSR